MSHPRAKAAPRPRPPGKPEPVARPVYNFFRPITAPTDTHFYNEIDPFAAAWLRELMRDGHLHPATIDTRSIADVRPADLRDFTQCHFFAGIGGWPLALQLAGWPADRSVWTGSAPCQPFSANGRNKGTEDHRDLWTVFFRLIKDRRPSTIFGEQSPRAIAFGWLDRLCDDMESIGYAVGAAVLPACSVGAPHERERLWWVADAEYRGVEVGRGAAVAVQDRPRCGGIFDAVTPRVPVETGALVDSRPAADAPQWEGRPERLQMADGLPGIVGVTRAYGNAIVPQVAVHFVQAFLASTSSVYSTPAACNAAREREAS